MTQGMVGMIAMASLYLRATYRCLFPRKRPRENIAFFYNSFPAKAANLIFPRV